MKRTIVFAAACMAGILAHAQSSVTLYGLVDLNVTHSRGGSAVGGARLTAMNDGTVNGHNGSRWGIRTTEDLGGGLRAGAVLEAGVLADSGAAAQGGRAFGRQIFLSLGSSAAGELRLGRQYTLHDVVISYNNPFINGLLLHPGYGVTNAGRALPQMIDAPRVDNAIQYTSPRLGGFALAAQYAFGESVTDSFYGAMASFANGPIAAALSHEWNNDRVSGASTNKVTTLGANYDFGVAKVFTGYQRGHDLTTAAGNAGALTNLVVTGPFSFTANGLQAYTLGVSVPIGNVLAGANYTRTDYRGAAGQELTLGRAAVGARYNFSKNTFVYSSLSASTGELKEYITQKRVVQVGLRTAF